MSNKGLTLRLCKECDRKRYCQKVIIPGHNYQFTCSKGHVWILKGVTLERVNLAVKDMFDSLILKNLFERDDTFFRSLKNKR